MKRPNPTIGMIVCPMCSELGAVRRDKQERFYYVCACGMHPAHGEAGQTWVLENATIWGTEGAAPDDAPDWIKRGLGHPPGTRSPFSRPRAPVKAEPPVLDNDDGAVDSDDEPSVEPALISDDEEDELGIMGFQ